MVDCLQRMQRACARSTYDLKLVCALHLAGPSKYCLARHAAEKYTFTRVC